MLVRRPTLVLLTATVLVLSACSGGADPAQDAPAPAPSALLVDGEVDPEAAEALVAEARSLEPEELQQRAAEAPRGSTERVGWPAGWDGRVPPRVDHGCVPRSPGADEEGVSCAEA